MTVKDKRKTKRELELELEQTLGRLAELEAAHRELEERYRGMLEVMSEAVAVSKDGVIVDANPGFASMTGCDVSELIGMTIEELADGELNEELVGVFYRPDESSKFTVATPTDSSAELEVKTQSVPYAGSTATMATIKDVTCLKRAEEALQGTEERYRAIFEADPDCVFMKDRDLRFTAVNPAMERLFGLPASRIIGRKAEDLYGEEAAKRITEWDMRVLQGESIEQEHTRPYKGQMFTFLDVRVPVRDGKGSIIGVCGICRDITERKKTVPVSHPGDSSYPSKAMSAIMGLVAQIAATDGTVLLQGESGTGKDYLARWIHDHSPRSSSPFFSVNCAALPQELAESELFGHEAAAFTGARGRKKGLLELAEGGTLLLNEIGELPTTLQAKLLTFLDSKSFLRVGGQSPVHVDARLIAATHRDLNVEVYEGRFLEPLFYRLNVFPVRIPPLRERLEDVPVLCKELMARVAWEIQLSEIPVLESAAIRALSSYQWPGNIRELRNVLERSLMLWTGGRFELALQSHEQVEEEWSFKTTFPHGRTLRDISEDLICALCVEALQRSGGNKREAARILRISRDTLYRYIDRFGIGSENLTHD
jgi:two-component system, NtrC family, response regulator AtoC